MPDLPVHLPRRSFLRRLALGGCALTVPGAFAEALTLTPRQTEGPFYPDRLPLDTDNDLLLLNDSLTPAVGEVTHLTGRVLTAAGSPVRNAVVEIWQVDAQGVYRHTRSPRREALDDNFQGFGRFLTSSTGEYYFRTIKPVPYSFGATRPPHIHVAVNKGAQRLLTTQLYIKGHPANEHDGILRRIHDEHARASVLVDFTPLPGSLAGELAARFDIVLGHTPEDPAHDRNRLLDGTPRAG